MAGKINISRAIAKSMGIFGGVQIVSIVCSVVRTKLVAMWLGSTGVGLFGLYNSALEMINTATNLGVRSSSVRDISVEKQSGHRQRIAIIISVVRRWSWFLGLVGATLTIALAPLLSTITFGDNKHIWGFVALSSVVLVMSLTNGEQAVLQGTAKLKRLANGSLWGVVVGLTLSIPMYYYWREDSIIPSIIVYALACGLFTWLYRNKDYQSVNVSVKETYRVGKGFISLGIFMTVSNFLTLFASYIFMSYLNHVSGTEVVGYYNAGYTLVNRYTLMILAAIGMEYYPRLAAVSSSSRRTSVFVSQEAKFTLAVLIPVICVFILCRSVIVSILYVDEFKVILPYISWAIIGIIFRALSWCMAYVILARGSGKIFLVTEGLSAVICITLNIACYHYWGLVGLGVSFLVWYALYLLIICYVYFKIYHLKIDPACLKWVVWGVLASGLVFYSIEQNFIILTSIIVVLVLTISGIYLKKKLS